MKCCRFSVDRDCNLIDRGDNPVSFAEFIWMMRRGYGKHLATCSFSGPNSCRSILDHETILRSTREDSRTAKIPLGMGLADADRVASDRMFWCGYTCCSKPAP
jgi:hypothetical protein